MVEKWSQYISLEYAVTRLSINHDVDTDLVTITDVDRQNLLSNAIQKLVKEKKDPDLDPKISNSETKDLIIPFKKNQQLTFRQKN